MAITAQDIFNLACDFIDERLATGAINATTTAVYKVRTPGLLTAWQDEMATELVLTAPDPITALTDTMTIAYRTNAAYFLASQLLLVEDPATAAFFNQKYLETKTSILKKRPATIEPITDVYADAEVNDFNQFKALDAY